MKSDTIDQFYFWSRTRWPDIKIFIESFSPRREFQNDSRIIKIEWREPYLITSCLFKMFKSQGHFFDKYLFRFYLSSTSACNDPMSCDFSFFSYHFPRLGAQRGARVWVSSSEKKSFDTITRTRWMCSGFLSENDASSNPRISGIILSTTWYLLTMTSRDFTR